jgi:hypothetical protein
MEYEIKVINVGMANAMQKLQQFMTKSSIKSFSLTIKSRIVAITEKIHIRTTTIIKRDRGILRWYSGFAMANILSTLMQAKLISDAIEQNISE